MGELLGFNLIDTVHYDIWHRIVNRTKPHVLLLMFRHGIKSTVFNYLDNLCTALREPEKTTLLYSATQPLAMGQLTATKKLLENDKIRKHFGNINGEPWNDTQANTAAATGKLADNTYTFMTGGVDKGLAAIHVDKIKSDDIVNEENYEFPNDRKKVERKFRTLFNLLKRDKSDKPFDYNSGMWVIGTRYHPSDLYGMIISEMSNIFEIILIDDRKLVNGIEMPMLPKVHPTMAHLAAIQAELGPYGYNCQMRQDPNIKSAGSLNYADMGVISDVELQRILSDIREGIVPREELALIMEPADEIGRGSNHTALLLVRYNGKKIDLLRAWKWKRILDDCLSETADIIVEYGLKYFYCEKSGMESNVEFYLTQKLAEHNLHHYVIMEPVSHTKTAKVARIMALQPFIHSGKVRRAKEFFMSVSKDSPPEDVFKLLKTEMEGFPSSGIDDLIDGFAYSIREEVFDLASNIIVPDVEIKKDNPPANEAEADERRRIESFNVKPDGGERVEYL